MKTNIGLAEQDRKDVVNILNTVLSDEYVLYTKTRNYHWNVTGPQFNDLHAFFETQYTQLNGVIDEVAERARALDGSAFGTLTEFGQHTRLGEPPNSSPSAREMAANLLQDHETLIRHLRVDLDTCAVAITTQVPVIFSPASWNGTKRWRGCSGLCCTVNN